MISWKWAALVVAVAALGGAACAGAAGLSLGAPTPSRQTERLGPPILSEAQAIEAGTRSATFSRPGVSAGQGIRNPRARLMTLQEYEDRFTQGTSYGERGLPVWVITMEGEWQQAGLIRPESSRTYTHGVIVLDAHTGVMFSASWRFEPVPLGEAEGLDPKAFATYPPGPIPTPASRPVEAPMPTATPALPAPTPTPLPRPSGLPVTCSPQVNDAPCAAGVELGKLYPYTLYTHCGIRWAYFNGRWWEASPPLDDGSGNPPRGWGNPYDTGTMELVSEGLARFTSMAGHITEFKPLPAETQAYPGRLCA